MLQQRATSSRGKAPPKKDECRRCGCKTNFNTCNDLYRSNQGVCRDCWKDMVELIAVRNRYAKRLKP